MHLVFARLAHPHAISEGKSAVKRSIPTRFCFSENEKSQEYKERERERERERKREKLFSDEILTRERRRQL